MKQVGIDNLPPALGMDAFDVIPEFPYPGGRTDLVFVNVSDSYWERRVSHLDLDIPITNRKHLIAFLNIHGRGEITEKYYYSLGPMNNRHKKKALEWLKSKGFIIEVGDDKIRSTPEIRRHITTTFAVELKISKWRTALEQAAGGRAFAEYKYVALDSDHVDAALSNLSEFKEKEVGLMAIDSEGNCDILYEPSRGDPYSTVKRWEVNETTIATKHA